MQPPTRQSEISAWTVQPWAIWERLQAGESLVVDWNYSASLHLSYDWLRESLCQRLPNYSGRYPWWAYLERPDLRTFRHRQPLGNPQVLLELSLPRSLTAIVPAWAWELIFDGRFVSRDQRESDEWTQRLEQEQTDDPPLPLPEPWRSELYASWDTIFDPAFPRTGWNKPHSHSLEEAVFERLDRSLVRRATRFVGANPNSSTRSLDIVARFGPTTMHR